MNRQKEKVTARIEQVFPQYHDLIRKTEPVSLQVIQKKLNKNEVIVDYLLSNQYSGGKRKLFVFLISPESLDFRELRLDSLFARNADLLRKISDPSLVQDLPDDYFKTSTKALNYMYLSLIRPVEDLIRCKRLIIIPDEEISWLSFDSFLKIRPVQDQSGYEGLDYLIKDYTFSYGYSSSLISGSKESRIGSVKVFAFSPEYRDNFLPGKEFSTLKGAGEEIGSIFKWFRGKSFTGGKATKSNFMAVLQDPAIFHLAMHSMTDSLNSRYSYLMFDTQNISSEQGKLFNYEISLTHIKSPMVVLSACNSGGGTLYSGEGLMSLARGFTLAGSVVGY